MNSLRILADNDSFFMLMYLDGQFKKLRTFEGKTVFNKETPKWNETIAL